MPNRLTGTSAQALPSLDPRIAPDHGDYPVLAAIVEVLLTAAEGSANLQRIVGGIIRDCIDRVIQTPKTARLLYSDLQNSEKTYIGTAVEIDLRSSLALKRGTGLDLSIAGYDVDVKFSQAYGWALPPEVVDKPCILLSGNDKRALFSMGVVVARRQYLNEGQNRDGKRTLRAADRVNIWRLARHVGYPPKFWHTVDQEVIVKIAQGRSGNERMIDGTKRSKLTRSV